MMNLWGTTHAELFAEHFLCFSRSSSLQVCACGATEHSGLLFTAVTWPCLLLPRQKKPLCKLLPVFCAGTEAARGIGGVPIPGNAQKTCGCGTGERGLVVNTTGGCTNGWKFGYIDLFLQLEEHFVIESC